MKQWRYLVPNALTGMSILFALLSVMNAVAGDTLNAAWFALYCVLTDKLDGFAARALRATSEFGVQLDSFADFASFGVAPAVLFYSYLSRVPEFGFGHGLARVALQATVAIYVIAVATRLARFNVSAPASGTRIYFGVPTTVVGGMLMSAFAAMLKYADPQLTGVAAPHDPRLLGAGTTPIELFQLFPVWLLLGSWLMHSPIKVPKLSLTHNLYANIFILLNIAGVYGFGVMRWLPEYLAAIGISYVLMSVVYGHVSAAAREARRPPLLASAAGRLPTPQVGDDDDDDLAL
jgi:CDP-diacylglycerol--serine O-phosphatidyltransferase